MNQDPTTELDLDDEKQLKTRTPMEPWDRIKFLLLFIVVWVALVEIAANNNPLESLGVAARLVSRNDWWILVLLLIELIRQTHYMVAERNAAWYAFWENSVVPKFNGIGKDWNDWTRYRVARVAKVILVLALASILLAAHYHQSPFVAIFLAPVAIVNSFPTLFQYLIIILLVVVQFAAIFWFMARGGVEIYYPGDVKTRFDDVWGQDAVLDRVKENIIFLKDPELIEERGGYVPGGMLLWGPPGTGKTLIAEAVAGETESPFVFVEPGALSSNMFMGVGILKIKRLFRKLRKLALRYGGVVVFMDEADSLGNRGQLSGAGGFSDAPWTMDMCHGSGYLNPSSAQVIFREGLRASGGEDLPPRQSRSRYIFPGGAGGGMGSIDGSLQALLTEISGLKKPRGFVNRVVRRALGLVPKDPPKYRILMMMATNMPQSLDEALLRPGRIDRIYKVGYPSKAGRIMTYNGYLDKVNHSLTEDEIERLAVLTPYATGATIKDLVNEALIITIRDGRDTIEWKDIIQAKMLKALGPSEDVEYIERERHAVAVHEACHAVVAVRMRHHMSIDIATIEKGNSYLGMVSSKSADERFTQWRGEYEVDIMVALASLAGERYFYAGDNSSGVAQDLRMATYLASWMEANWGMGSTISSQETSMQLGIGGSTSQGRKDNRADLARPKNLSDRIEAKLEGLYRDTMELIESNRLEILAVAHALETHKTIEGEDVEAIVRFERGPIIDGSIYRDPELQAELENYHAAAVKAHHDQTKIDMDLPRAKSHVHLAPTERIIEGNAVAWSESD